MTYFYLSNLYRSYNITGADLLNINLGEKEDVIIECLALIKGPKLECWNIKRGQSKLLASFELNCKVKHFIKVKNLKGGEDSCLVVTHSGLILFFNISSGKLVTRTRMSIQGKNLEDIQIVYTSQINSSGCRFVSIFDKNSEILVLKIKQTGEFPVIEEKFSVYSMIKGVLLFEVPEYLKSLKESDFLLGMVCGSQLYHHFISFLDINSKQKDIKWMNERKEINLASRDNSEIVQEKIFEIFHICQNYFVAFCAFSLM